MILLDFIESFYIYFMYNIFKTKISFNHPLENILMKQPMSNYFKHPIQSDIYENKICPFGKLVSKMLVIWIFIRRYLSKKHKKTIKKINKFIFILVLIGSLIMNLNSFIYLIPIFIFELYY